MSRRQFTTLKLLVSLPLPAGMTQKAAFACLKTILHELRLPGNGDFPVQQIVVKQVGKEVTYL